MKLTIQLMKKRHERNLINMSLSENLYQSVKAIDMPAANSIAFLKVKFMKIDHTRKFGFFKLLIHLVTNPKPIN